MALGELSGSGQRLGAWEEQRDAILGRRGRWQQPQCAGEPACRARGRARGRVFTGHAQDGDRRDVAVTRGVLDVVCARGDRRAARRQALGSALVGAQAPTAGRRLVDGAAHDRVAEAEPTRHVGHPHQVAAQQLVKRLDRRRLRYAGRGRREVGLERVTRHRRTLEHQPRPVREHRELLRQRRGHHRRHPDTGEGDILRRRGSRDGLIR